jgi:hypothetical protein
LQIFILKFQEWISTFDENVLIQGSVLGAKSSLSFLQKSTQLSDNKPHQSYHVLRNITLRIPRTLGTWSRDSHRVWEQEFPRELGTWTKKKEMKENVFSQCPLTVTIVKYSLVNAWLKREANERNLWYSKRVNSYSK